MRSLLHQPALSCRRKQTHINTNILQSELEVKIYIYLFFLPISMFCLQFPITTIIFVVVVESFAVLLLVVLIEWKRIILRCIKSGHKLTFISLPGKNLFGIGYLDKEFVQIPILLVVLHTNKCYSCPQP